MFSEPHEPNCRVKWAAAWLLLQKSLKSAIKRENHCNKVACRAQEIQITVAEKSSK